MTSRDVPLALSFLAAPCPVRRYVDLPRSAQRREVRPCRENLYYLNASSNLLSDTSPADFSASCWVMRWLLRNISMAP